MVQLEKNWTNKAKVIDEMMTECAPKPTRSKGGTKTKRRMSGYNCFMKECAKSKSFGNCLTEKGWGKLNDNKKAVFNNRALEGCN